MYRIQPLRLGGLHWAAVTLLLTQTPIGVPTSCHASDNDAAAQKILTRYCVGCHNANDSEGDFALHDHESLMKGTPEGSVISAGKPDESRLLKLITGAAEPPMPPEDEEQPTPSEIAIIRNWIASGAAAPAEPMRVTVPEVAPAKITYVGSACLVDGNIALGSLETVQLRSGTKHRTNVWTVNSLPGKVNSLRLAPQDILVAGSGIAGVSGMVALIDATDGRVLKSFPGHTDAVYCASLSPNGKLLASGSYDRTVLIRDATTGEQLAKLTGHNGAIYDLDFSSDGKLLATASADQTVKLWSVPDFERLDTFGQPEGEMYCVRFSPSGDHVFAAGSDRQIRKWKIIARDRPAINPMVLAVYAHEAAVQNLDVSDGIVISAASDFEAKQWSTETLAPLGTATQLPGAPVSVNSSPLTNEITAVSLTGKIKTFAQANIKPVATSDNLPTNRPFNHSQVTLAEQKSYTESAGDIENRIDLPAVISGRINPAKDGQEIDEDLYVFDAVAGQTWIFELKSPKDSPLDSWLEILDADDNSVLRTRLQALRESYFTFRGKDSSTSDDFRMHRWEDMELDEYLYSSGEVTRLWLYPRGPDSGFKVYPGTGARHTFFDTTPIAHALGEPAYVVRELAPTSEPLPNGLPVFPLYFENDDDPLRRIGKDSRLTFTPPTSGKYKLRVRDARGFGGPKFAYSIDVRAAKPDFDIKVTGGKLSMPIGSGREWGVSVTRQDGLSGPIRIELDGLPDGFLATNPLIIEENQSSARGTIFSTPRTATILVESDEKSPVESSLQPASPDKTKDSSTVKIGLTAKAMIGDREIVKELPPLSLSLAESKELQFRIVSLDGQPIKRLTIAPGATISAKIILDRNGNKSAISFGKDDSGRNLPHGAYVDNIGLNGLLIPEQYNQREFFITAAPKLKPGTLAQFHLRTEAKGNATSEPIWLEVVSPNGLAKQQARQ